MVAGLIGLGAAILGGIVSNVASDAIVGAMAPEPPAPVVVVAPPEPTVLEIIFHYLPQVSMLVVILCCLLMYIGILKRYDKKIVTFIVPVVISLIYCVLSSIFIRIFGVFEIVALGLYIMLTAVYAKISLDIFKGKSNLKYLVHKDSNGSK